MGMPPARGEVVKFNRELLTVVLKQDIGDLLTTYRLDQLNRPELMRLMSFLFPGEGTWTRTSDELMKKAARTNNKSLRVDVSAAEHHKGPPSPRQEKFLKVRRMWDDSLTFGDCLELIDQIKQDEAGAGAGAASAGVTWGEEIQISSTPPIAIASVTIDDTPKPMPEPDDAARVHAAPTAKPEPVPGSIDAMIRALAEQVAAETPQTLNADEIKRLIADEIKHLTPEHKTVTNVTRIELPGRDVVELSGRQHTVFPKVLDCVDLREHVYLVGPAGTGKSTIGRQVSEALGVKCFAMSCNPQMPESRIFGFVDAQGVFRESVVYKWWCEGGVLVLDEVDNGHPGILSAFNLMLSSDEMTWPNGEIVKKHEDAVVIACANTYGSGANSQYVGRNMLDGAFLDRFVMVHVGIDAELEADMVKAVSFNDAVGEDWLRIVRMIRANVDNAGLKVIVSPRAAVTGAKLIKRGWKVSEVIDSRVLRGLTDDQRNKAMKNVSTRL